jgi:hypothetical protein
LYHCSSDCPAYFQVEPAKIDKDYRKQSLEEQRGEDDIGNKAGKHAGELDEDSYEELISPVMCVSPYFTLSYITE